MVEQTGPPPAPVLRKNGFCLRDQTFSTTSGRPCVEGSRLKELFYPGRLHLKGDQKSAREEAKTLFRKDFFAAQLRWYGIQFKSNVASGELEKMLRTAVAEGKVCINTVTACASSSLTAKQCTHVPESVLALERSMRADRGYAEKLTVWRRDLEEWNAAEKRKENENWATCSTPGEQANNNLDKFMALYFLDDQGEPDPTKTAEPMALHGFANKAQLHEKAKRLPGLETRSGGEGSSRTICIGWDRKAVWDLASRLDDDARSQREKEKAAKWDRAMAEHNRLAELVNRDGPKVNPKSLQPARIQKCKGSYLVDCEAAAKEWPSRHLFTLDIANAPDPSKTGPFITLGWLSLAHFEGKMLLSLDQQKLDNYVQYGKDEVPDDSEDDEDSDSDECSEEDDAGVDDDGGDEEDTADDGNETEDEDTDSEDENDRSMDGEENDEEEEIATKITTLGKKRKATSAGAKLGSPPAKKGRNERVPPRRIHLRLRGRETGEGMILHEPHDGYIEFTDDSFTQFKGVADLPYLGKAVIFEGFKISHIAKKRPEPWENVSSAAYEHENDARWGRSRRGR